MDMASPERVAADMAYQHSISPPLDEETLPLALHERPTESEIE